MKKIGIITIALLGTLMMMNCNLDPDVCGICGGGNMTYTMSNGDSLNKVVITLSSGQWIDTPGRYQLGDMLSLTETSRITGLDSSWIDGFNSRDVYATILQDKSKMELIYYSARISKSDGSWTGTVEFDYDRWFSYTNHEGLDHDFSYVGGPITITVSGTDTLEG